MASTTFSGPVRSGTAREGAYTNAGKAVLAQVATLTPLAQASTDFVLYLPAGAQVTDITTYTSTAYTGTTVTAQVGSTSGGAEYVAAVSVKSAGTVAHTLVAGALGSLASLPADATVSALAGVATAPLYIRIAQTGATAVGAATMVVRYIQN
jgi:hypothetical protein